MNEKETISLNIENDDINNLLKNLDAKKIFYKKNNVILINNMNIKTIGIIINGHANIERYDYNGNRTIIENLEKNSIFSKMFFRMGNDITIMATSDCEILFIEYDRILRCSKNTNLINHIFSLLSNKILDLNMRLAILSKRTIRDKILTYFLNLTNNKKVKTFILPFNYADLADYLSVNRSAMMRELTKLEKEGCIKKNGKEIALIRF